MKAERNLESNTADSLLSIQDVAGRLAISVRAVWRLIQESKLPAPVKIGRCSRLYSSDVNHFLEALREQRGGVS